MSKASGAALALLALAWWGVHALDSGLQATPPRALYLTQSAGFRHEVLPLSEQVMSNLAEQSEAFALTVTGDCALLTAENLQRYDAVIFYTTGELPMSREQKTALLEFVRAGNGFVGVHSATDTFYEWPEYGEMIGGYFDGHPWTQEVTIRVEAPSHLATQHLAPSFTIDDEIYQFRNWSRTNVHVLLSLDVTSVDLAAPRVTRQDRDYALAWTRRYGQGRVFYTALGHRPAVWHDPRFQRHLAEGIRWALAGR